MGEKVEMPDLAALLSDDTHWQIKAAACGLLAKLNSKSAIPKITALLADDDWDVRQVAQAALEKLREK
jgi:HEAT repeat protein